VGGMSGVEQVAAPLLEGEEWLPRREIASRYGVAYSTVRLWEYQGKVRTRQGPKQNDPVLVYRPDVDHLVDSLDSKVRALERRVSRLEKGVTV
jgi:hypothetical protein